MFGLQVAPTSRTVCRVCRLRIEAQVDLQLVYRTTPAGRAQYMHACCIPLTGSLFRTSAQITTAIESLNLGGSPQLKQLLTDLLLSQPINSRVQLHPLPANQLTDTTVNYDLNKFARMTVRIIQRYEAMRNNLHPLLLTLINTQLPTPPPPAHAAAPLPPAAAGPAHVAAPAPAPAPAPVSALGARCILQQVQTNAEIPPDSLCVICLDVLVITDEGEKDETSVVRLKRCGHLYHKACIKAWITAKSSSNSLIRCPLDRIPIM